MKALWLFLKGMFMKPLKVSSDYLFEYDERGRPTMVKKYDTKYQEDTKDV